MTGKAARRVWLAWCLLWAVLWSVLAWSMPASGPVWPTAGLAALALCSVLAGPAGAATGILAPRGGHELDLRPVDHPEQYVIPPPPAEGVEGWALPGQSGTWRPRPEPPAYQPQASLETWE